MIDTHIHATMGWTRPEVARTIQGCGFDMALLAAAPLDHWGSELNEGCARILREFPDKLAGLIGIHPPNLDQALRDIETYGAQGFIGIKLMPTVGYYPDDERYLPIFEEVNRRKWMVLTHCGWCSQGVKARDLPQSTRFSDPYHIEPLARVFTQTDFILAHGGGRTFFPRAAELTHYHANVYVDTCPGQGIWVLRNGGEALNIINWAQVLFGTDTSLGRPEMTAHYHETASLVKNLLELAGHGSQLEGVLHDNAARLLRKHGIEVVRASG